MLSYSHTTLGRYNLPEPREQEDIHKQRHEEDQHWGSVCGVLVKWIEDRTVERQGKYGCDDVVDEKDKVFIVFMQSFLHRINGGANFDKITADKQCEDGDDGTGMHQIVKRMRSANGYTSATQRRGRREEITSVQLQYQQDEKLYKEHRAKYHRKRVERQQVEQVRVMKNYRQPKQYVEERLQEVIPIGVSIEMYNVQTQHSNYKAYVVEGECRCHHR